MNRLEILEQLKLSILFPFTFFLFISKSTSQSQIRYVGYNTSLLHEADSLFSLNDTSATLLKLTEFVRKDYERSDFYYKYNGKSALLQSVRPSSLKADICIVISQLYSSFGKKGRAISYLDLASWQHLPRYGGCLNGMIMYRTKLSIHYANYYLKIGAYDKAVDHLLNYFLSNESGQLAVARMLRGILLNQYSQEEITAEVENGLLNMFEVKKSESNEKEIKLTFFDVTISKYSAADLEESINYYKNHPSIKILINEIE